MRSETLSLPGSPTQAVSASAEVPVDVVPGLDDQLLHLLRALPPSETGHHFVDLVEGVATAEVDTVECVHSFSIHMMKILIYFLPFLFYPPKFRSALSRLIGNGLIYTTSSPSRYQLVE